ncbi:MAG: DUF3341 domain-containing protein [Ignavibacteriaceae bacterium]|nr:DUF3341 domain-containing protein [Ignavibacteriaceae bacterium]
MNNKKFYGLTALFNTPNEIIKAAKKLSSEGYTKFDVHTPYPLHGMDDAMRLKPSKLGYITLFFGLSGAALALLFMYWTMSIDYPMVIGGKPFFALPAFIPIAFEVTVLLATLSTVIGMLTFFFNFPNNNHPLIGTDYLRSVSVDKFGIAIESDDEKFNNTAVRAMFGSLGAVKVEEIYYPDTETFPLFQKKFIFLLLTFAVITSGTTYFVLNKLMFMQPFSWMMLQDKLIPQEKSEFFADGFGMRVPVEGTIARGHKPYEFKGEVNPSSFLINPIVPSKESMMLGKKKFLTFCSPCHGNFADGDSRLRGQFPNPPTLHTKRVRDMVDGQIFHIITNGQNIMASYASQTSVEERWAIVNYVRALERAKNATQSDLDEIKKESAANGK